MTYVDFFLIPCPKAKLAEYRKMARFGERVWMEHGALDYKECVADDLNSIQPDGKRAPSLLPKMARLRRGETVIASFIVFRSRAHRDSVNKKVLADARMQGFDPSSMPVEMGRMGYGGFKTIVESGQTAPRRARRPARKAAAKRSRRLETLPLSGRAF